MKHTRGKRRQTQRRRKTMWGGEGTPPTTPGKLPNPSNTRGTVSKPKNNKSGNPGVKVMPFEQSPSVKVTNSPGSK